MGYAVKKNKPFDSIDVTFLGSQRIMLEAQHGAHLIKQFRLAQLYTGLYSRLDTAEI
jgi:hypothetical protein